MIESIRAFARSWVAKGLLALLVLSFAAFGITDVFTGNAPTVAAVVGEEEISTAQFDRQFRQEIARAGNIDVDTARSLGFDQIVLAQMAAQSALNQEAEAFGIDASDTQVAEAVRSEPSFQGPNGSFDPATYANVLRFSGMRQRDFEEDLRQDLARAQLLTAVAGTSAVPRGLIEAIWKVENETRDIAYVTLYSDSVADPGEPTQTQTENFHQDEAQRFTAPEYRKISLLVLDSTTVADPSTIDEDTLRTAYDNRIDDFRTPERRNIDRLIFNDTAAAEAALQRIRDGEAFVKIASERGFEASDVALGYVRADEIEEAIANAAFGVVLEGVVGPVETTFGPALVNIQGVIPAGETPFEEAREDLAATLAAEAARSELPDLANAIEDLRAAGATLEEVASKENLTLRTETLSATGLDLEGTAVSALPEAQDLLPRVFAMEIGEEMDLVPMRGGGYYAAEVMEITASQLRPLDTVREEVVDAWKARARRTALEADTRALMEEVNGGTALSEAAASRSLDVQEIAAMSRRDPVPGLGVAIQEPVFSAEAGVAVSAALEGGNQQIVAVVSAINQPDPADAAEELERLSELVGASVSQDLQGLFRTATVNDLGYETNPAAIDYALGYAEGHAGGGMGQ
ncbi:MAG: SurA N-terminal domain-containing protein [Pseudomonadota bacterium]